VPRSTRWGAPAPERARSVVSIHGAQRERATSHRAGDLPYSDQARVARSLNGTARCAPDCRCDLIWTLATERSYLALVRDRGWRAEEYEDWLPEQLAAALLPR
jgi:hypothetical protein